MVLYTTILHEIRKKFSLSMNEYGVMDTIYRLSVHPKSDKPGWCYMSKPKMAKFFDIGRRTTFRIIDELIKKHLVVKNSKGYLKPTGRWVDAVEPFVAQSQKKGIEAEPQQCQNGTTKVPKRHGKGADLARNNYINNVSKDRESNDNPLGIDKGKTEEKQKTPPDLVKLFYALIDKKWSGNGFKMGVGIVQNLIEKRYSAADVEGAIRWGVKEKGMMDLTELPMKVNWFIGNRKREVVQREKEAEELGPGGREILDMEG